jgi:hypothetical protein
VIDLAYKLFSQEPAFTMPTWDIKHSPNTITAAEKEQLASWHEARPQRMQYRECPQRSGLGRRMQVGHVRRTSWIIPYKLFSQEPAFTMPTWDIKHSPNTITAAEKELRSE